MTDKRVPKISPDRPESDPKSDALRYAPFARQLAKSIASMSPLEGAVLAIYAPWGSGKSTLLNFVEHYLSEENEETQPIVVRFNPWWFSGDEALARHFFSQIDAVLESKLEKDGKNIRAKLSAFADSVAAVPLLKYVPIAGTNAEEITKSVAAVLKGGNKDVPKLKQEVSDLLASQERTILVVIDDIDRLTPEEVRQLFRLVKAVADFPRVVYLLSFDKDVVTNALAGPNNLDGAAYLEKIVQVPFDLPTPDRQSLHRMLFSKLDAILADVPEAEFDQERWSNVFVYGLAEFLDTPRNVVRLTNSLSVTFPAVRDEVNAVDFLAIEALRVFEPDLYDVIRRNPARFTEYRGRYSRNQQGDKETEEFRSMWTSKVRPERLKNVRKLIALLFPNEAGGAYSGGYESTWRRERRVSSKDVFPAYFRLALPDGTLTNAEMKELVARAGNSDELRRALRGYIGQKSYGGPPRIRAVLERLEDYTESEIPLESVPTFVSTLLELGDEIVQSDTERQGMFEIGSDVHIGRLIWQTLRRIEGTGDRFAILRKAFEGGASLATAVREASILGQQQGKRETETPEPQEDWIVDEPQLRILEKSLLVRIRRAAKDGGLLDHFNLPQILYRWEEWTKNSRQARRWATAATREDDDAIRFLSHFVGESMSQTLGQITVTRRKQIRINEVGQFLDVKALEKRLRKINTEALEAGKKEAVELFLKACPQGENENPEDIFE